MIVNYEFRNTMIKNWTKRQYRIKHEITRRYTWIMHWCPHNLGFQLAQKKILLFNKIEYVCLSCTSILNVSNKYYWLFFVLAAYIIDFTVHFTWPHCTFHFNDFNNVSSTVSFRGASTLEIVGPSEMTFVRCFLSYNNLFSVESWSTCAKPNGTLKIIYDKH